MVRSPAKAPKKPESKAIIRSRTIRFSMSFRNTRKSDLISGFTSLSFVLSAGNTIEGGDEERRKTETRGPKAGNCEAAPKLSGGVSSRNPAYFVFLTTPTIWYSVEG